MIFLIFTFSFNIKKLNKKITTGQRNKSKIVKLRPSSWIE
jgi:hypothetical protein